MTLRYILVQLIGLCGTLLFFFSYQCKSNRRLFQVQFASYVFYTAHLLLLGAVTCVLQSEQFGYLNDFSL